VEPETSSMRHLMYITGLQQPKSNDEASLELTWFIGFSLP
jgi:hypothetical protein